MGTTTLRYLIDSARTRHWSFSNLPVGDGPALLYLNQRIRTRLAMHGAAIEGLVGTTMQYDVPLTAPSLLVTNAGTIITTNLGVAIGVGGNLGQPQLGTTYQDGWPIHITPAGYLYVDFSEPPIAGDPFGLNGGVPGFPLPEEMVRLIQVSLSYNSNPATLIPCDVVTEPQRFAMMPSRNPACFISGNRLVPMLPLDANNQADRWFNVSKITISYVGIDTYRSLDDTINFPAVLVEGLIADCAVFLANNSKACPPADKSAIQKEAAGVGGEVGSAGLSILEEGEQDNVIYNG